MGLPCLGVLRGVPSTAAEDRPGWWEKSPSPWKRNILWREHPARVGLLSPPSLSFCETSALIRERALRMYDPCKHRVPIDQPPLLLGVCAGSRNKGPEEGEEEITQPHTERAALAASTGSLWSHLLSLPRSSHLPLVFPSFVPSPSSLLFLHTKNGPNSPLCSAGDFWGLFPRIKELTRPCPTPRDVGGHSERGGVPNPPPLPAQLCASLNNYSDESITIRPNSHSAELTQIILILCFYR